jgi:hypothetical protein
MSAWVPETALDAYSSGGALHHKLYFTALRDRGGNAVISWI